MELKPKPSFPTSFSKLTLYEDCPRRYFRNIVLGEQQPPNKYMKMGLDFHKFAETFHNKLMAVGVDRNKILQLKDSNDKFNSDFVDYELRRYELLKEHDALQKFLPVMTEHFMTAEIGGYEIRGVVDRVDLLLNDEYAVIDYKPQAPWDNKGKKKLKMQLGIYVEMLSQVKDLKVKYIGTYYYKKQDSCVKKFHPNTARAVARYVTKIGNKIEEDLEAFRNKEPSFLAKLSNHCNHCMFKPDCLGIKDIPTQGVIPG